MVAASVSVKLRADPSLHPIRFGRRRAAQRRCLDEYVAA
jgi:hypothetical protein